MLAKTEGGKRTRVGIIVFNTEEESPRGKFMLRGDRRGIDIVRNSWRYGTAGRLPSGQRRGLRYRSLKDGIYRCEREDEKEQWASQNGIGTSGQVFSLPCHIDLSVWNGHHPPSEI